MQCEHLSHLDIDVAVYRKPPLLLAINPRGFVPTLHHGNWHCHESTVLMKYLEDLTGDGGEGGEWPSAP